MEGDEERKEDPEHTRGATICRDGKNHGKSARGVALPYSENGVEAALPDAKF